MDSNRNYTALLFIPCFKSILVPVVPPVLDVYYNKRHFQLEPAVMYTIKFFFPSVVSVLIKNRQKRIKETVLSTVGERTEKISLKLFLV